MVDENILKIRERILSACSRAKREASGIKLVAVSKSVGIDEIKEAVSYGIFEFGENRVQDAGLKIKAFNVNLAPVYWHMIGHLQANKVKSAVKIFDLIQSVDSLTLAAEINREASKINKIQDVLLEVKTSPEATKSGIEPDKVAEVVMGISGYKNMRLQGLMTIAPLVENSEDARPYFRALRELKDKINRLSITSQPLSVLSMGMTNDFEIAIEEGSNMVRIGRGIFES